jgi:hypothetical protein
VWRGREALNAKLYFLLLLLHFIFIYNTLLCYTHFVRLYVRCFVYTQSIRVTAYIYNITHLYANVIIFKLNLFFITYILYRTKFAFVIERFGLFAYTHTHTHKHASSSLRITYFLLFFSFLRLLVFVAII